MGKPSDPHTFRKLTKKYLKFDLKRSSFNNGFKYYGDLQRSWTNTGMDSEQSKLIQKKIDVIEAQDEKEYRELKKMVKELPTKLNKMLAKNKPKYLKKGRNQREAAYDKPVSTFTQKLREEMEGFNF
jgi:hypothetical protein